jgi:hypothetical protein
MPACPHYINTNQHGLLREETPHGEANSTRCPGFQHHHWHHHDAGLESPARDGVPGQQWALDTGKQNGRGLRQRPSFSEEPGLLIGVS